MEEAITKLKAEMTVHLAKAASLIAVNEEADPSAREAAIAYTAKRVNVGTYSPNDLGAFCTKKVAIWFFQGLVDHIRKTKDSRGYAKFFSGLLSSHDSKREELFLIWSEAFRETPADFWKEDPTGVVRFFDAYVHLSNANVAPSMISCLRSLVTAAEVPDLVKRALAIVLLEKAGVAVSEIFDLLFPLYAATRGRSLKVFKLMSEHGDTQSLDTILLGMEQAVETNTLTRRHAFPKLIFFSTRVEFASRVEQLLTGWMKRLTKYPSEEMFPWMVWVNKLDRASQTMLDEVFMWIWNHQLDYSVQYESHSLHIAAAFTALARRSSYTWAKLEDVLRVPHRLTVLQFILLSSVADLCAIPRWVGSVAKALLRERRHSPRARRCAVNLLCSYGDDLRAVIVGLDLDLNRKRALYGLMRMRTLNSAKLSQLPTIRIGDIAWGH